MDRAALARVLAAAPLVGLPLLVTGCGSESYDVADLQVDVAAPLPADAETLHVCVSNTGELTQGAGNGRVAFTGLRVDEAVDVSVDVYDRDGVLLASAGPAHLDADTPYTTTPLLDPDAPCVANGGLAPAGGDSWLLALRFAEGA